MMSHFKTIKLIDSNLDSNPVCIHGPTLLFETIDGKRKYYACASCRRRKECNFYVTHDDWIKRKNKRLTGKLEFTNNYVYNKSLLHSSKTERFFCTNCSLLVTEKQLNDHNNHDIISNITDKQLTKPTQLLRPLTNNKSEAQYLFADKTVKFIVNKIIRKQNYRNVINIGAQTVHEYIQCNTDLGVSSILLDIDHRLTQFYSPNKFIRYNLFNHHFFDGEKAEQKLVNFVKNSEKDSLIVVIDPPFGGLLEAIFKSIVNISNIWKNAHNIEREDLLMPLILVFPYFHEKRIINLMPSLSMCDYSVCYQNHRKFSAKNVTQTDNEKRESNSSPVRMFTNIELSLIKLPQEDGYKYCSDCNLYVHHSNRHCFECNACTAKAGKAYNHCVSCKRCVKSSYSHCDDCGICHLTQHCFISANKNKKQKTV